MKTVPSPASFKQQLARLEKQIVNGIAVGRPVSLVILYHDKRSQDWAKEWSDRMLKFDGVHAFRPTWWKLSDLSAPGVLAGAVSTALRADVMVVATDASEGMPLPFYVWVKSWLPHRPQTGGAMIALLGQPKPRNRWSGRLTKFLSAVARQARMEFLKQERLLPVETAANAFERTDRARKNGDDHEQSRRSLVVAHGLQREVSTLGNPLLRQG